LFGTCNAATPGLGGRWTLKSFAADDEDLLKTPHTFEPGQTLKNVQVVFTDRRTEINLHVADESGQTTQEYVALLFPVVDKSNWSSVRNQGRIVAPRPPELMPQVLNMQAMGPGARTPTIPAMPPQDRVMNLRPGEYYAIAVDDLESEVSRDPFVLERLSAS